MLKRMILSVSVLLAGNFVMAENAHTVYGLQQAQQFTPQKTTKLLYIQANIFADKKNALQYQHRLQSKTNYSVRIKRKSMYQRTYYAVVIGPISSAVALRKTAASLETVKYTAAAKTHKNQKSNFFFEPHFFEPKFEPKWISPEVNKHANRRTVLTQTAVTSEQNNWFATLGAGGQYPNWLSDMKVQNGSVFSAPHNLDVHTIKSQGQVVTEIAAGYRWTTSNEIIPAYSLEFLWEYGFNNNLGGTITQYSQPEFLNYNYQWYVQSNLLLAAVKLNIFQYKTLSPFIRGGIGGAINTANDYKEIALPGVTPRVSPGFTDNSSSQFAYQLGLGLDLVLTPKIFTSFGYNYQNLGQVVSGNGLNTWSTEKLTLGSYHLNEFLITIHYLFDINRDVLRDK